MAKPRIKLHVAEANGMTVDVTYQYNPTVTTEQEVMERMERTVLEANCIPLYFEMGRGIERRCIHSQTIQKLTKLYKAGNAELVKLLATEEANVAAP